MHIQSFEISYLLNNGKIMIQNKMTFSLQELPYISNQNHLPWIAWVDLEL